MESWSNLPRSLKQELDDFSPWVCWKPLEWERGDRQPWNTYDGWSRMNAIAGFAVVGEKNAHGEGWWSKDPRDSDEVTL